MIYPLISILVPAYNHEHFITQCLDSIVSDSYPNKEIIIIDDGSKDNTKQVIENWINLKQTGIHVVFKSRSNKGITKTLNELIDLSTGEYIVILASDDYIINNGIQKRYNYLIEHPDKKAVFGDCVVVDSNDTVVYDSALLELYQIDKNKYYNSRKLLNEFIRRWVIPGPVLMVRKEIYEIIGKYDENLFYEDWDFYLRMARYNLIGFLDDIVAVYRVHNLNTCKMKENQLILWENTKMVANKHYKYLPIVLKIFVLWMFNIRPNIISSVKKLVKTKFRKNI